MQTKYTNWQGCSRWTNASRNMATHITATGSGDPLCGKNYKGGTLARHPIDLSQVTCKPCLAAYKNLQKQPLTETA